ncbi:MAG: NapF, partial [Candidatus Brocadiaceae bacterium]|nr:NapF [Candidatus Brocadiaceae bacterium]
RCTQCGACVTLCPSGAITVDHKNMRVGFNSDHCIACGVCVSGCPSRAMLISFQI